MRGRTPGGVVNLLLYFKVSDENNSKAKSIDLSSFKMQFLPHCYSTHVELWKDNSHLGCESDPICGLAKRSALSLIYAFPKCIVLSIDSVLRIGVSFNN